MPEFKGRLLYSMPMQQGEGRNGTWYKKCFVLDSGGQYAKKVAFEAWGDKAQQVEPLILGTELSVEYEPESREYNGKWYTTLKAWKLTVTGAAVGVVPPPVNEYRAPVERIPVTPAEEDDLPF